ncbi:unnamed protein product (macronuclear) [Paramecium tetraurelia]|uniref:PH domain-containing protein n=1 Tax=Paramecium tetraurelia TaxID=5888 RepID=A0D1Q6_PARTE|nr:uncharacterized protein GSPATT00012497001 [Paramecium tetraurelia]CAK76973.1 unnamed protein product [Paramecium tetraurelia]|eukprot:XP_001444370.1 hypothetical protein (macronuclear) [Paramecium tetraurelia strain d4-2]
MNQNSIYGSDVFQKGFAISSKIRQDKGHQQNQVIENEFIQNNLIKKNPNDFWFNVFYKRKQNCTPMKGRLQKKSPHFFIGFQWKYCELENRVFSYYKSDNKYELEGALDFDLQEFEFKGVLNERNQTIQFTIIPKGTQKEFVFQSDQPENTHLWALQIKIQLNDSIGSLKQLRFLNQIPRFWKNTQLKNTKVLSDCQDGDIALFKSKDNMTKVLRAVTLCEFDHVCLLYRDNGQLCVFEAVSNGVGTFLWSDLTEQKFVNEYEKICIRRLNYAKRQTPEVQNKLREFIKNNLGKEYGLNPGKLLQKVSLIVPQAPQPEDKQRTYFCSELVAKAYKEMGLLELEKSSTQYFPSDFTAEKKLQLLQGATLDPEMLVIFET